MMTRDPEKRAPKGKIRVVAELDVATSEHEQSQRWLVGDYDSLDDAWRVVLEKSRHADAVPEMAGVMLNHIVYDDEGNVIPWPGTSTAEDTLEIVDQHACELAESNELGNVTLPRVSRLVNRILADAVRKRASTIHFEPQENRFVIRHRIDGVLRDALELPISISASIAARLKIMASMDIAERRLPQNGYLTFKFCRREVALRISSMSTSFGEKLVVWLLDRPSAALELGQLGLEEKEQQCFEQAIRQSQGMIVVTGPTGSGKATTLYAALARIASREINVVTVEPVVKYQLATINQILVSEATGPTFSEGLHLAQRQDADVILVSELRDAETARLALETANSALLFSTLHVNDAPSAVAQFLNMGIPAFLVASSLSMVIGQRLCRRLCMDCRRPVDLSPPVLLDAGFTPTEAESVRIFGARGCATCGNAGYLGRTAIYEILSINADLQDAVNRKRSAKELKEIAVRQGMRTLRRAGLRKVALGITTLDEILRVTPGD
ncbi:MAG: type II/IV secretion system protein [Betaproteobacteria bacterium]|nr:type II/IV secretion system protein [Betaproteobacteria bacterium]